MEKQYKVVLLAAEPGGGFYGHIVNTRGKDKGDALLDALANYASKGRNLGLVKKTRVFEVARPTTLRGLLCVP